MSERIKKLLICPNCKETFSGNLKELSCRHIVCESPCFRAITSSRTPRCPECNAEHVMPSNNMTIDNQNERILRRLQNLEQVYETLPKKNMDSDDYDNVRKMTQKSVNISESRERLKEKIRDTVKESIDLMNESIKRFRDIVTQTGMILAFNCQVAENWDLKRFFQKCEHQNFEIDAYLRRIKESVDIAMDVDVLLAHMWQCEEHLSVVIENEFHQLIFYVKNEFDKHSPNQESFATIGNHDLDVGVPVPGSNAMFSLSADKVDGNTETHSQGEENEAVYDDIIEKTPQKKETNCVDFKRSSKDGLGMCIWNSVEYTSVLAVITACIMIVKTSIEICWVYWLIICWFKRDKRTRQYICSIVILVVIAVGLISDIVLVYVQEEDVNLPLLVMRIIAIVDIVWTFMILLTIWLLAFRCFRH